METLVKFVTSPWFAWYQVFSCSIAVLGFYVQGQKAMAWVWFCYTLANLGFVAMAGGFE